MQLNEEQKKQVTVWIEAGAKLSDVQQRLADELGIRLTYMEARFLLDDLKLSVKEAPVVESAPAVPSDQAESEGAGPREETVPDLEEAPHESGESVEQEMGVPIGEGGSVSVKVDTLARPGALVSGSVVFSDGNRAAWYLDQMGRLGLNADVPGYRPPQADIVQFQQVLERELSKSGF